VGMTQGYQLDCFLPFAVHLDHRHIPETQGYLGLLTEPYTTPQLPLPVMELWMGDCCGWPNSFSPFLDTTLAWTLHCQ